MSENTPFFIVGAGRSGTTLLRLILAGHTRLHIPPETWFIRPLVEAFSLSAPLTPPEVERAVGIITQHYRWPDMAIEAADFQRWVAKLGAPRLVDIIDLVYRRHREISRKPRIGDKTPSYFNILPELSTLYPGARFIYLVRDGRDVAISFHKVGWASYRDGPSFPWNRAMNARRTYEGTAVAAQILDVRYEDLVADTEATVTRICAFLGETFEPAMLDWRALTGLVPERERSIHQKLDKPISTDAIGVWRTELSVLECFAVESCLYENLLRFGYRLRFGGPGWRPLLRLSRWALCRYPTAAGRLVAVLQRWKLLPRKVCF